MPIAVVIGADPLLPIVAAQAFPVNMSQLRGWGALAGRPIQMVKAETVDLLVPARAEHVLEGEILQDVRAKEGPSIKRPK